MFERDYIQEVVGEFAQAVAKAFGRAFAGEKDAPREVEQEIGDLLDLDHETALALSPDSLVTMMILSGIGDSVASYVAYSLDRLARVYEDAGEDDLAGLRRLQAKAVAESFGCDLSVPPAGLEDVEKSLTA